MQRIIGLHKANACPVLHITEISDTKITEKYRVSVITTTDCIIELCRANALVVFHVTVIREMNITEKYLVSVIAP